MPSYFPLRTTSLAAALSLSAYPAYHFSWHPIKSFLQIHKTNIELLAFNSKIILHLSCHKNGIIGSLTFHESKLHVINVNLLPNSLLKNPFYNFNSMFQQFDPSVQSTLHRVAFAFVDWQYHT